MDSCNFHEAVCQTESMNLDESNEADNWEVERHLLKQQIKELQSALNKTKKFHQKFVDEVIQTEEIRIQEFDREKKELVAVNKRQNAEIRELTKDKLFYETTCTALIQEKEKSSNADSQSVERQESLLQSKRSTTRIPKLPTLGSSSESKYKISTKLFLENKKLKEKVKQLTKSNAGLRLNIKQLENFKNKIESRKEQQVRRKSFLILLFSIL